MAAFTEKVRGGGERTLWLDYADYAGRLLAGGSVPWLDVAAFVAWIRKAQGLLRADVIGFPVDRFVGAWLAAHPTLGAAMAAKSRAAFPIKTLLGDEAMRAELVALVKALRAGAAGTTLALSLPSPRAWVAQAYRQAHGTDVDVGDDEADAAALYIADFARAFGEAGVDVLELVETAESEPESAAATACYQAVCNVAGHYRWDIGLRVPGARYDGSAGTFDFITTPGAVVAAAHGQSVAPEFWSGAALPATVPASFWYATIPAGSTPEIVLERLALLR